MNTFTTLKKLADLVSDIDMAKSIQPEIVPHIITVAADAVDQMKMDLMDIGDLDHLIHPMASIWANRRHAMPLMIESAHAEIERLLGADACKVYLPEAA